MGHKVHVIVIQTGDGPGNPHKCSTTVCLRNPHPRGRALVLAQLEREPLLSMLRVPLDAAEVVLGVVPQYRPVSARWLDLELSRQGLVGGGIGSFPGRCPYVILSLDFVGYFT